MRGNSERKEGWNEAEFDEYGNDYDSGMHHGLKSIVGENADAFIDVKVRWLDRTLTRRSRNRRTKSELKLLDFGCGDGIFLKRLQQIGVSCKQSGCDVSSVMLMRARERLATTGTELRLIHGGRSDFENNCFDVAVVSSVLHHVTPKERPKIYRELNRVLAPGGVCVVFEHNPFNPIVRYVVATTPIDRNAQLLRPSDVRHGMHAAGFATVKTRWLMFFPPRWLWTHRFEWLLQPVPIGGQYVVTGEKASLNCSEFVEQQK